MHSFWRAWAKVPFSLTFLITFNNGALLCLKPFSYFTSKLQVCRAIGFRKSGRLIAVFDGNAVSTLRAGPRHFPICHCSVYGAPDVFSTTSGVPSRSPEVDSVDGFVFFVLNDLFFQ